jgi:hypothetical protein
VGTALLMTIPLLWAPGLPLVVIHARVRDPRWSGLLIVSTGYRFAIPAAGRFDLALDAGSSFGPFWAELVFVGPEPARLLVLRDQIDARAWRCLRLAIAESN